MRGKDCDVAIIGAGVAGLSAAAQLGGKDVQCLEATGRMCRRIFSLHDPLAPLPIDLGAEFIHGRSLEIWRLIRAGYLAAYETTDHKRRTFTDERVVNGY